MHRRCRETFVQRIDTKTHGRNMQLFGLVLNVQRTSLIGRCLNETEKMVREKKLAEKSTIYGNRIASIRR
jgi:hypothetical protein